MVTSQLKNRIISKIISAEGRYVNDPKDSGGETMFGITKTVAAAHGYTDSMAFMPMTLAYDIYSSRYWDSVKGDDLLALSHAVAEEVVDTGVNMGPVRAGKFLQFALNVLNTNESLYGDVVVDGVVGPMTIHALKCYLTSREEAVLVKALNCLQGAHYMNLAKSRPKDERFVYGWLKNRVAL
jgi:lysozyme family protein